MPWSVNSRIATESVSSLSSGNTLPVTVVVATRNEEKNIHRCISALGFARHVVVVDSSSTDDTARIATALGAQVIQFAYKGGYPKKRQWVLDTYSFVTDWVMLVDADEVVTPELCLEIERELKCPTAEAFVVNKEFHFLGKRLKFGGFSFGAVVLFRLGAAHFENLFEDSASGLDMEVHERLVVTGKLSGLKASLLHHDFKDLAAYISRHNSYSTWEAHLRYGYLSKRTYGRDSIVPRFLGNVQERRRFLKLVVMKLPLEPWIWFVYHYICCLGFLEGHRGLIACQIRSNYIREVRAKIYELTLRAESPMHGRSS